MNAGPTECADASADEHLAGSAGEQSIGGENPRLTDSNHSASSHRSPSLNAMGNADASAPVLVASVIIPAYQAAKTIGEQLAALVAQDFPDTWEIVVVDDGSTAETRSIPASFAVAFPSLRVISNGGNHGVNHARNRGVSEAAGELLLFCDADDVVAPGWVAALVDALRSGDAAGGAIDLEALNPPRLLLQTRPALGQTSFLLRGSRLPSAFGCCFAVRRSVWARVGGFDERIHWGGCDEVDFFWRLQLAGHGLVSAPDALVARRLRPTLRKLAWQELTYGYAATQLLRGYGRSDPEPLASSVASRVFRRRSISTIAAELGWLAGCLVGRIWPDTRWAPLAVPAVEG